MRPLRLVGLSDDGASVVLEDEQGERFSVPNDEALQTLLVPSAAETAKPVDPPLTRIGGAVSTSATTLSPRDIQTRVRAGESPEKLANESGTPLEKVMRFAEPVLQERFRITDEARRGKARRGGDGALVTFGELADSRFTAHGVELGGIRWDAFRRDDGGWTVLANFSANDKELQARFAFALANRTVSALDEIASDLLSGGQIRALLPEPPPPVHAPDPEPAAKPVIRLASVPDPDDAPTAEPIPLRPQAGRQRAHTRHLPVAVDDEMLSAEPELFDQTAFEDWSEPELPLSDDLFGEPPAAPVRTAIVRPGPVPPIELPTRPVDVDPEPVPVHAEPAAAEPAAARHAAEHMIGDQEPADEAQPASGVHRRKASDKPRMPSWDDILLGVRRKD